MLWERFYHSLTTLKVLKTSYQYLTRVRNNDIIVYVDKLKVKLSLSYIKNNEKEWCQVWQKNQNYNKQ